MNKLLNAAESSAGHNKPAILTPDMLARDFGYIDSSLSEIERLVAGCPPVCEDEIDLDLMRTAVRRCVGAHKRLETLRVEAKEPYLSAERVVDAYFNKLKGIVANWQAKLEAAGKRYLDKIAAAEKARREEEAHRAAEEARKAAEIARKAEQDRIDAEHDRMVEQLSEQREAAASQRREEARLEEVRTREVALQRTADALAAQKLAEVKPADLARTRTGDGLSTLQQIWLFEVVDLDAVDLSDPVLRACIPAADIEKAIGRYVKTHKGDRPLNGVRIYADTKPLMT